MTKSEFGPINVNMGNGNVVGDIGHKIVFRAPPPNPNTIYQGGRAVGLLGSPPEQMPDGTFTFEKLFFDCEFDIKGIFEVQKQCFRILKWDIEAKASHLGRPTQTTLLAPTCESLP
jgi:hypothetical protein